MLPPLALLPWLLLLILMLLMPWLLLLLLPYCGCPIVAALLRLPWVLMLMLMPWLLLLLLLRLLLPLARGAGRQAGLQLLDHRCRHVVVASSSRGKHPLRHHCSTRSGRGERWCGVVRWFGEPWRVASLPGKWQAWNAALAAAAPPGSGSRPSACTGGSGGNPRQPGAHPPPQ